MKNKTTVSSELLSLGIDFYRNFIGIEKPLEVDYDITVDTGFNKGNHHHKTTFFSISPASMWLKCSAPGSACARFENIKPHLKLIEDLTDEEVHFVFGTQSRSHKIHRYDDYLHVSVLIGCKGGEYYLCYDDIDQKLTKKQFELLSECHCDLQAKEYIDDDLAVRIK